MVNNCNLSSESYESSISETGVEFCATPPPNGHLSSQSCGNSISENGVEFCADDPPRGGEGQMHIRHTSVSLKVLFVLFASYSSYSVYSCVSQSHHYYDRRSTLSSRKQTFITRKCLEIASDVLNSSHRVRKRTFSNVFRCRGSEASLRRESSVVPRVERCRTLRLTASALYLLDF